MTRHNQCKPHAKKHPSKLKRGKHLKRQYPDKGLSCEICGRRFTQLSSVRRHNLLHTGEKPYRCKVCDCGFLTKWNFEIHLNSHTHRIRSSSAKKKKASIKSHESLRCVLCDRKFESESLLDRHLKGIIHKNREILFRQKLIKSKAETVFRCTICSKECSDEETLILHTKTHTARKSIVHNSDELFRCDGCNRKFTTQESLNVHLKSKLHQHMHSESPPNFGFSEKPRNTVKKAFHCQICNKPFLHMTILQEHEETHNEGKSFSCTYCNGICSSLLHPNMHNEVDFSENSEEKCETKARMMRNEFFRCDVCGKEFFSKRLLNSHQTSHISKNITF